MVDICNGICSDVEHVTKRHSKNKQFWGTENQVHFLALRKLAHAIYTDFIFLALKIENFQLKIFDIVRGGSNEYPQSMFWSKNKKNRYTPAYTSFAI